MNKNIDFTKLGILKAKRDAAEKVWDGLMEKYVRNDVDYDYYGELYKRTPKGTEQRKTYLQNQMASMSNMEDVEMTLKILAQKIQKYDNEIQKQKNENSN